MNEAFRLMIDNKDAPLIAVHKARYFAEDEKLSLGPGGFVTGKEIWMNTGKKRWIDSLHLFTFIALEYATGSSAITVGKPTRSFFELALKQL
jgi:ribonucleotide monophosphatase NagD (HAD superfamily)